MINLFCFGLLSLACNDPWLDQALLSVPITLDGTQASEVFFSIEVEGSVESDTGGADDQWVDFDADIELSGVTEPVRVLFYSETSYLVPPVTDVRSEHLWNTGLHSCEILAGTTTLCWQDYRMRIEPRGADRVQDLTLTINARAEGEKGTRWSIDDPYVGVVVQ